MNSACKHAGVKKNKKITNYSTYTNECVHSSISRQSKEVRDM